MKTRNLVLAGLFVIAFSLFLRLSMQGVPPGPESYYHLRVAQLIHDDPSIIISNLYSRELSMTPFTLLLAIYPKNLLFASALALLFAVVSAYFFYCIVKKLSPSDANYSSIMLVSSPIFIYLLLFITPDSLAVLLTLAAIYSYIAGWKTFSRGLATLLALFSPFNIFLLLGLLLMVGKTKDDYSRNYLIFLLAFSSLISSQFIFTMGRSGVLSDFGNYTGFSLMLVLFAIAGTILRWNDLKWPSLLFFALIIGSIKYPNLNIYANFYLAYAAGISLRALVLRKWVQKSIGTITLLLVLSSILFSTLSFMTFVKEAPPNKEMLSSLSDLALKNPGRLVLSSEDKSPIIFFAGLKPFVPLTKNGDALLIAEEIFSSRSLPKTRMLLEENGIDYLLIDDDLSRRFSLEDKGILFIISNNEVFDRVYAGEGMTIYRYRKLALAKT